MLPNSETEADPPPPHRALASRLLQVLIVKFLHGPEKPAGDKIKIAIIGDGFVIMANRGAEYPAIVVVVGPNDNGFSILSRNELPLALAFLLVLKTGCQSLCPWKDLYIVIEFRFQLPSL